MKKNGFEQAKREVLFEVKSCVVLGKYICLSTETVEKICDVAFKYAGQGDIITRKNIIYFLDSQIRKRNIKSKRIANIIRRELLKYVDDRINNNCKKILDD